MSATRIEPPRAAVSLRSENAAAASTIDQARALNNYGKLPVAFIENMGQTDARVRYYALGNRFAFYLTQQEVVLAFANRSADSGVALGLRFVGANPHPRIEGVARAPGEVNFLQGDDPAEWRTHVARYRQVAYRELWPGIDLHLREQSGALKYEFHVRSGARPSDIRLAYAGATRLSLDDSGALLIETGAGVLRDAAPVTYQEAAGTRVTVQSRYALDEPGQTGRRFLFAIDGGYDPNRQLIIDPGIQYTTFLGGGSDDTGAGIVVDGSGNAYIGGTTQSPDFPTTAGAFKRTGATNNFAEAFVSKLNASGTALVYSTFIGGSDMEFGRRIAIDAAGNAYITGQTKSSNFPVTGNAFDRTLNIPPNCPRCIDNTDGFVTKLNATGSGLVYSTYLGGTDYDSPRGIAVDAGGNAYVIGETLSADFPTTAGAFRRTLAGSYDIFVTKLNASGSALAYSTFVGGTQVDNGERVAVDASGNAYVMGFSSSLDFPTTVGAFDRTSNGDFDVTLTKLNPSGSGLIYSTYLGGQGSDTGGGLVVNDAGEAYVSGGTGSLNFPTTAGALHTPPDGSDNFVTKFNATGSALVYSAVFGGTAIDGTSAIDLDAASNAWITGTTTSADYPTTADAADRSLNGGADAFISELNANGSALLYSTLQGGSQSDSGVDIAVDNVGDVYVTGRTLSADYPVTAGAFDTVWAGDLLIFWGDAFVTKIDVSTTGSTSPPAPQQTATLTVNASGRAGERIISSPAGIDVPTGSSGSAAFNVGTSVTLSVSNGRDAIWSGACSSGGNRAKTCTFTLNAASTVNANVQ